MADENTVGVESEWDSEAFNKGLNAYIRGIQQATTVTQSAVTKLNSLAASTQKLTAAGPALTTFSRNLSAMARSLSALSTVQLNQGLIPFLNNLATAGGRVATVAPGMAEAGRSLASFSRSLSTLSGLTLSAAPITQFTTELFRALSQFGRFKTITNSVTNLRSLTRSLTQLSGLNLSAGSITNFAQQFGPALLTISRALRNMSNITKIPQATLATLSSLGNIFQHFGQAPPNVGPFISALSRIASLLPKLSKIQQIPQAAIDSISHLTQAMNHLSGVGNLNPAISAFRRLIPLFIQLSQLKPIPPNVMASITKLGGAIGQIGNVKGVTQLSSLMRRLTGATNQLAQAQAQATPKLERFQAAFTQGVGVGIGFGVVNTLQRVAEAIANLGREALNSIRFFETFTVSVQSAIATQIRFKDNTISMTDALAQSVRPARAILRALEQLAVFSPFTTEQVGLAFRTATAYGFTAEQALNLTRVLVDFTSGAGLTGDELARIALALSQVSARGKLAGEEVRQLANAGVPIIDILAKALGKAKGEILQMIKDGKILAGTAIPAILKHMKQWEGSGKRLAETFTGLLSSLTDIKQIAFRDFFGGAFAPLRPVLQELVDFLNSDQFKGTLIVAGELIGKGIAVAVETARSAIGGLIQSFQSLSPETKQTIITFSLLAAGFIGIVTVVGSVSAAVIALVNPFTILVAAVAGFVTLWVRGFSTVSSTAAQVTGRITIIFSTLAKNMVSFGRNIVTSLAAGMTSAIGIVTKVLSAIARLFTRLLKPGSPPLLLPDLDVWGAGAAQAYLEGWTVADFSALDSFAGIVRQHLDSLATLGQVNELGVPEMVATVRNLFLQALNEVRDFGAATQETIQRISETARLGVSVVSGYIQRYAAVREATEAVTAAQNELNATIKAYDDQLRPLNDRLKAINREQQAGENAKTLKRINRALANTGITDNKRHQLELQREELLLTEQVSDLEAQKEAAQSAGQAKLDAAQATLTAAQQELDLFNAQIAAQQQQIDLQAESKRLMDAFAKSLEDAADKLKEGLTELEKQMKVIELQRQALQDNIDAEEARFVINDKNSTAAEKYAAALKLQEISLNRQLAIAEADKLKIKVDFTEIDKIPIVLEDFRKGLKDKGDTFTDDEIIPGLSGGLGELDTSLGEFEKAVDDARTGVTEFFTDFQNSLDQINAALPSFLQWKQTGEEAATGIDTLKTALIGLAVVIAGRRIIETIGAVVTTISGLNPVISGVLFGLGILALAWKNDWLGIQEVVGTAVDKIDTFIGDLVGLQNWVDLKALIEELGGRIKAIFTGEVIPENAVALIQEKVNQINAVLIQIGKGLIVKGTGKTLEEITQGVGEEADGLFGLGPALRGLDAAFNKGFSDMIAGIKKFWADHINDSGLIGWIGDIVAKFIEVLGTGFGKVAEWNTGTGLVIIVNSFKWLVTDGVGLVDKAANDFLGLVVTNFVRSGEVLFSNLDTLLKDVIHVSISLENAVVSFGTDLGAGLAKGWGEFFDAVGLHDMKEAYKTLFARMKADLGIHSPSTVMHDEFGLPLGEGFTSGFVDALALHQVDVTSQLTTLTTAIQTLLANFGSSLVGEGGFFPTLNTRTFTLYDDQSQGIQDRLNALSLLLIGDGGYYATQNTAIFTFYDDQSTGVTTRIEDMNKKVMDLLTGPEGLLQDIQTKFVEKGFDLGQDFASGLAEGMLDKLKEVEKAARKVVSSATAAAKDEMEAKSPSKVVEREAGRPWGQGFAKGILNEIGGVIKATEALTGAAMNSVQRKFISSSSAQSNVSPITNNSTRVFNLNVSSAQSSRGIVRDFGVMQVLAG